MPDKKFSLVLFALLAAAQLYVPISMIIGKEAVLEEGTELKFRTAPVDPTDPFRGKYIWLSFTDNRINFHDNNAPKTNSTVYVTFKNDSNGYALIDTVLRYIPKGTSVYLRTQVANTYFLQDDEIVIIDYPFDRFYMEEYKARPAEDVYNESRRDTSKETYALVAIKDGRAVLKDVLIDDVSIKEIVEGQMD